MAEQLEQSVPPLAPVVPSCRIKPHRVYSLQRVHKITGLSRVVLQRLADSGEVRAIKTGNRGVAFGGIAVPIMLGLPPPEIPMPIEPQIETPHERRSRGKRALDQVLKTTTKKR